MLKIDDKKQNDKMTVITFVFVEDEIKGWIVSLEELLHSKQDSIKCRHLQLSREKVLGRRRDQKEIIERLESECCNKAEVSHVFIFLSDNGSKSMVEHFWVSRPVLECLKEMRNNYYKTLTFVDSGISEDDREVVSDDNKGIKFLSASLSESSITDVSTEIEHTILEHVNNRRDSNRYSGDFELMYSTPPSSASWLPPEGRRRRKSSTSSLARGMPVLHHSTRSAETDLTTDAPPDFLHHYLCTVDSPTDDTSYNHEVFENDMDFKVPSRPSSPMVTDRTVTPSRRDSMYRYCISPERSYLYMLGYHQFDGDGLDSRLTSTKDLARMQGCFEQIGFQVFARTQLSAEETLKYLTENVECLKVYRPELIICVITSHGEERLEAKVHGTPVAQQENRKSQTESKGLSKTKMHYIYCKDGTAIETAKIIKCFQTHELKNVPKVFLIQACSATSGKDKETFEDHGTDVRVSGRHSTVHDPQKQEIKIMRQGSRDIPDAKGRRMPVIVPVQPPTPTQSLPAKIPAAEELGMRGSTSSPQVKDTTLTPSNFYAAGNVTTVPSVKQQSENRDVFSVQKETITVGGEVQTIIGKVKVTEKTKVISEYKNADEIYHDEEKTMTVKVDDEVEIPVTHEETVYSPEICPDDSVVVFASASGKFAYSHYSEGGWLFSALEKAIDEKKNLGSSEIDFMEVLTNVTHIFSHRDVEHKGRRLKCVSSVHHRLRKDIILKVPQPAE